MFAYRHRVGPVDLAFTDRIGGVSAGPYDALNLALDGPDDIDARVENHRLLLEAFGPGDELVDLCQVHGASVDVVERGWSGPVDKSGRPHADAVVTAGTALTLMVRAADCVPLLFADPQAGVIGAAHAGREGIVAGVAIEAIREMRALGADKIEAWVGPYVCGACYEVPEAMRAAVGEKVPQAVSRTSWGTPALDLGAGIRAQLEHAGVTVHDVSCCTRESADLYSYRRDGTAAGRHAGIIRLAGDRR